MTRLKCNPSDDLNYTQQVYTSGGYANTNELPMLETPDHKDMVVSNLVPSNYNWMSYTWEIADQLLPVYDSPRGRIVAELFHDDYEVHRKVNHEVHCCGYRATTSAKVGTFAPGNLI